MALRAQPINCSLKRGGDPSSTDRMIGLITTALGEQGADVARTLRIADHDIKPGVTSDEGQGDAWPDLRRQILAADILVFGTPIWLGQPSSIAKRVLERMNAFLDETDDGGRMPSHGKVAIIAVVGNEDGAHHVTAELLQALNDVGWTFPAVCACYWVGAAMQSTDFKDLETVPDKVSETVRNAARGAAHLAGLLQNHPYPG